MPTTSEQQINVRLPKPTIRYLDRLVKPGQRGHFIDQALRAFFRLRATRDLSALLRDGARHRAARDRQLTAEWSSLAD